MIASAAERPAMMFHGALLVKPLQMHRLTLLSSFYSDSLQTFLDFDSLYVYARHRFMLDNEA